MAISSDPFKLTCPLPSSGSRRSSTPPESSPASINPNALRSIEGNASSFHIGKTQIRVDKTPMMALALKYKGQSLMTFRVAAGGQAPIERARQVLARLSSLIESGLSGDQLSIKQNAEGGYSVILGEDTLIVTVTKKDADAQGVSVSHLASTWLANIKSAIDRHRSAERLPAAAPAQPVPADAQPSQSQAAPSSGEPDLAVLAIPEKSPHKYVVVNTKVHPPVVIPYTGCPSEAEAQALGDRLVIAGKRIAQDSHLSLDIAYSSQRGCYTVKVGGLWLADFSVHAEAVKAAQGYRSKMEWNATPISEQPSALIAAAIERAPIPHNVPQSVRKVLIATLSKVAEVSYAMADRRLKIIVDALSWMNTPYVWGGTTQNGADCSGFTQAIMRLSNVPIHRLADGQYYQGRSKENPQAGDLVFFTTYLPGPSHVGIYIGQNQFVHVSSSNGVEINTLDKAYWGSRYLGARDMFPGGLAASDK